MSTIETAVTEPLTQAQADAIYENMKVLGADQMTVENKVASLERNQKILVVGVLISIGGSVVLFKAVGNLTKGLTQFGMILRNGGLIPPQGQPAQPEPKNPGPPSGVARVVVEPRQAAPQEGDPGMVGSDTWDPGPQTLPEEVRQAVEQDQVTARVLSDEDNAADLDALISSEPVEQSDSPRVRHNAQGPR